MSDPRSDAESARSTRGTGFLAVLLRLGQPLPGALAGAAIGFHLCFRQPGLNTDTAAPLVFAIAWATGGFLAGAIFAGLAGALLGFILRRLFPARPVATAAITLFLVAGLCLALVAPLESRLPTLIWPPRAKVTTPSTTPPTPSPCAQLAPTDPALRRERELECR